MARPDLRHPGNAGGDWFVDTRCIDCGTCREIAPDLFGSAAACSVVVRQPAPDEATGAWLAAQACPTSSIGTLSRRPRPGRLYPREIAPGTAVYDLGYCSPDSFGASSWLLARPGGNVMVDAPRFTEALAAPLADLGGVAHIALTHADDVADADRWAARFGARVWIHEADRGAAPYATDVLTGADDALIAEGMVAVPVPGHTRGSTVFVLEERYLFTGDSLAWSHERDDLTAFRYACWWSWTAQATSLERLAATHAFEWVLPGHGGRVHLEASDAHRRLIELVGRMRGDRAA